MNTSSFHIPTLTKLNKLLIIALAVLFILTSLLQSTSNIFLSSVFGLSLDGLLSGKIFQVLTYPLFARNILELLFDSMIIWFIGSDLESLWGDKRYLSFLLSVVLGSSFFYLIASSLVDPAIVLSGPSIIGLGMCLAFGVLYPDRIMYFLFFPVKARYFVLILIAMSMYNGFFSPKGILAWGQLGAFASAWAWMVYQSKNSGGGGKRKIRSKHLQLVKESEAKKDKITYH